MMFDRRGIVLLALLLTGAAPVLAQPEGMVLSAAVGAASHGGEFNYGDSDPGVSNTGIIAQSGRVGFDGLIAAGYNLNVNQAFRLTAELSGQVYGGTGHPFDVTTTDNANQTTRYKVTERLRYSVGLAIKPVFQLNQDSAFFLSLGYQQGHFKDRVSEQNIGTGLIANSSEHQRGGWQFGLGLQFNLSPNLATSLSVDHTRYKRKIVWPVGSANGMDLAVHSHVTHALLGLTYYMGA